MDVFWYLALVVVGVVASAFFSGMETGLISLNRLRLRHDVERKDRRASILNGFVEDTERFLGTTLIGNNLANVLTAVGAGALAGMAYPQNYIAQICATILIAAVLLVFGEITPKSVARHYSYRLSMTFADVMNGAAWLFAPLVALLGVMMRAIVRVGKAEPPKSFFVTREELKHLAKEGEAGGALTTEEREMIHGVFDFPHKTVYEVMLPLSRTVTVAPNTSVAELFDISQRTGFARFPVREGEKVLGIANVYEILFEDAGRNGKTVDALMRKPQFVVSTDRIDRVLPVLRAGRNPISVVVNPEGKHVGIITIEDIVEEIVGDVEG
jgi:putative hemolysin